MRYGAHQIDWILFNIKKAPNAPYGSIAILEYTIDERTGKRHEKMIAPQLEYIVSVFEKHFDIVDIVEYSASVNSEHKAIVARQKKIKNDRKQTNFNPLKLVRSQEWWLYKIAPLLTIAYAQTLLLQLPPTTATLTTLTALLSITSVAAYGYLRTF